MDNYPKVSIGMPIRNGVSTLAYALESILAQDYPNIEILISDNCSDDGTYELCKQYEEKDSRVKLYRQPILLTALQNFRYVLDWASGDFFVWAADDDWRDATYITRLLEGFGDSPETILTFGDLFITDDINKKGKKKDFSFDNTKFGALRRMRKTAHNQCYHIYGVWKREALLDIPFNEISWWPDMPIMMAASALGKFKYVEGVSFRYLENIKTNTEAAQYLSHQKKVDKFRVFRLLLLSFVASMKSSNIIYATFSFVFVLEKQFETLISVLRRKLF